MLRLRCIQLLAALALLMPSVLRAAAPVDAQDAGPGKRPVLAYYRADVIWTTWAELLCDRPLGIYVSADASAVDRHVREALSAGIDAFVQAWHGPSIGPDPTASNFRLLLDQADPLGFAAAVQVDLTSSLLDTTDEVRVALEELRDDLTERPGYLLIDGRPVVFFLGQARLALGTWEALRGLIDPGRRMIWVAEGEVTEVLDVFDGLYLFHPDRSAPSGSVQSRLGSQVRLWQETTGLRRYWVATTMPGYDDRLIESVEDGYVLLRNGGMTYRDSWAAAAASDPDWLLIRSFNEWDYCTHIERSEAFGTAYMDLTADLVSQYGNPVPPSSTPTTTPVPPSPTATETPIAAVPSVTATMTAAPSATPAVTSTAMPTATRFWLATPTPAARPATAWPSTQTIPAATATELARSVSVAAAPTSTPRTQRVVEGDQPRSCFLLPLLFTAVCCWGARRRSA